MIAHRLDRGPAGADDVDAMTATPQQAEGHFLIHQVVLGDQDPSGGTGVSVSGASVSTSPKAAPGRH